jgi:hypothetical protein
MFTNTNNNVVKRLDDFFKVFAHGTPLPSIVKEKVEIFEKITADFPKNAAGLLGVEAQAINPLRSIVMNYDWKPNFLGACNVLLGESDSSPDFSENEKIVHDTKQFINVNFERDQNVKHNDETFPLFWREIQRHSNLMDSIRVNTKTFMAKVNNKLKKTQEDAMNNALYLVRESKDKFVKGYEGTPNSDEIHAINRHCQAFEAFMKGVLNEIALMVSISAKVSMHFENMDNRLSKITDNLKRYDDSLEELRRRLDKVTTAEDK